MSEAAWRFADVFEAIADAVPSRPAVIQGKRVVTWGELERRTTALARQLPHRAKVAAYLTNCPAYLETYLAAFKAGATPVNCNYRYGPEEMAYLLDNADAEVVVFHTSFTSVLDQIRAALPRVRRWLAVVDDGSVPPWAEDYEAVVADGTGSAPTGPRSGDDLLLLYTGGTTGMPKGVMWRQDDLFNVLGGGGNVLLGVDPPPTFDELVGRIDPTSPGPVVLVACPLMHGTGQFSALSALTMAGTVVLLAGATFDVAELWQAAAERRADSLIIVGQAFSEPMLDHLRSHPGRYDLTSLRLVTSSGVMWSQENKDGLLELLPGAVLFDNFGSSEAVGVGGSVSRKDGAKKTAEFKLGRNSAVFTEDGTRVEPGSGQRGLVAVSGFLPLGYYKDEAKTAATFRTFEGRRWSVPGDWAEVHADGRVTLLGRGSACINTGGEKVFPEEVEEVLKRHPAVRDAAVVGVPDERFGEAICALVETRTAVDGAELAAWVKERLAAFKAPRHVLDVETIGRAPNGKVDYKRLRALAVEHATAGLRA
jgi:fatty-acyl-CoA synthase